MQIKSDTKEFTRKLKLKEKFHGSKFHDDSIIKQRSNYNPKVNDKELNSIIDIIERTDPIKTSFKDNLSLAERNALEELRLGNEISMCNNIYLEMPPPIDLKEISMCNNIYLEMPPPIDLKEISMFNNIY